MTREEVCRRLECAYTLYEMSHSQEECIAFREGLKDLSNILSTIQPQNSLDIECGVNRFLAAYRTPAQAVSAT